MTSLVICDTQVRTDSEGRYCLNDLHKAAGEEQKHQPANWLRMQQTQELVAELDADGIPHIRGIESRQGLGTFVVKELVYAYAMWISPRFHLQVIRAYDALVRPPAVPQEPLRPMLPCGELLYTCLEVAKLLGTPLHIAQSEAVKTVKSQTGADFSHLLAFSPAQNDIKPDEEMLEPTELGKRLGISARDANLLLLELGLQERKDGEWCPTASGRALCSRHAWSRGAKCGYNYKWNVQAVESIRNSLA